MRFALGSLALSATTVGAQVPLDSLTSLAREAYVIAYPALESYRTMYEALHRSSDPSKLNQFSHSLRLADASSRWVVRPNNDTFYGSAWLDLRSGAVVLTIPPASPTRYRSAQVVDQFTHNVAIISEPSSEPRRYLIVGPTWTGTSPAGVADTIRLETGFAFVLVRTAVYGQSDSTAAAQLQQAFRVESRSASTTGDVLPPYDRTKATTADFVSYLNAVLQDSRLHERDQSTLGAFAPIGVRIRRGTGSAPLTTEQRDAVTKGATEGLARVRTGGLALRSMRGTWGSVDSAFGNRDRMAGRPLVRASAAMYGLFGLDREEAVYMSATIDSAHRPLNGSSRSYVLRFSPDELPPATAFWSITVYDSAGYLATNEINRYSVGDRTPGIRRDADGGLTLLLQVARPAGDSAANWLPIPRGSFSLTLRVYRPDPARIRLYAPPAIHPR